MTTTERQEGAAPAPATIRPQTQSHRPQPAPRNSTRGKPSHSGRRYAPIYNRVRVLMVHAPRYGFQGQARLAADAGVSRSTISRLISGRINPSFRLAQAVAAALEKQLKRPLSLRETFSPDGKYPTPSGCALAGCRGCMPEEAYDAEGSLRPEYRDLRPSDWSLARPSQSQKTNPQQTNTGKESR